MQLETKRSNNLISGASYFVDGIRLLLHPELRLYILVPLVVNCFLFFILTTMLVTYLGNFVEGSSGFIPDQLEPWIAPLKWVVWTILGVFLFIFYAYSFNMITNVIAAPFYGLLAEKAEQLLTGRKPAEEALGKMIPRVMLRELQKLLYFFLRGIFITLLILLIACVPLLQFAAPLIGLAWGAWSMSIQYADYPADNHRDPFRTLRSRLGHRTYSSFGFGGAIMACSIIPVVNIFAMPAAVAGGTIFWVSELQDSELKDEKI